MVDAWLVSGPVLLPLVAAGLTLVLSPFVRVQRALGPLVLAAVVVMAVLLLVRVDGAGPVVVQAGGHAAPYGISLVADRLSALVLVVSTVVLLAVLVYAIGQGSSQTQDEAAGTVPSVFHPAYLVLTAGVSLVFLTGDLFTLFVGFEVMLMASYTLITLGATADRVRAGTTYVVTSLLASIVLLTSIALVYALTGTVNLADLSARVGELEPAQAAWLSVVVLAALATKAAVVPVHWWLPDSYPDAPAPVTAVFAALLTKVAVYAVLRTQTLLFPRDEPWTLLLVLATVTFLVGVVGALAQDNLSRVLSFLLVSHIGFMLLGIAVSSAAGTTATVLYLVHHVVVQATLFLVVGLLERHRGTARASRLGGVATTAPLLSVLFLVPALSLGGIPPLAGFVGKLGVVEAAVQADHAGVLAVAAVALLTSLLTLAVMARAWCVAFWGEPAEAVPDPASHDALVPTSRSGSRTMLGATAAMVVVGLLVAGSAGPLSALAARIGADLEDPDRYRDAVLGPAAAGAAR